MAKNARRFGIGARIMVAMADPSAPWNAPDECSYEDGMVGVVVGKGKTLMGADGRRAGVLLAVLFDGWGTAMYVESSDAVIIAPAPNRLAPGAYHYYRWVSADLANRTAAQDLAMADAYFMAYHQNLLRSIGVESPVSA